LPSPKTSTLIMFSAMPGEFLCSSPTHLDGCPQSINKLLQRQSMQIRRNSIGYSSVRQLVEDNRELFQIDFALLNALVADSAKACVNPSPKHFPHIRLRAVQRLSRVWLTDILSDKGLTFLNLLLTVLAERLKIKAIVFYANGNHLTREVFGRKKSASVIHLFRTTLRVHLLEFAPGSFDGSSSLFADSNSAGKVKASNLDSELSNEESSIAWLQGGKDIYADRETTLEVVSFQHDIRQIHHELFGEMFDHSDDSMMSIQSEDFCKLKSDHKQNNSFSLQIHKTISEFSLATEESSPTKLLSLKPVASNDSPDDSSAAKNRKFQSKVLYEEKVIKNGKLKFYSEENDFGFIIMETGEEIFVHKDDLIKANIDTQKLAYFKKFYEIQVSFRYIQYQGKMKVNRKAVDVQVTGYTPLFYL